MYYFLYFVSFHDFFNFFLIYLLPANPLGWDLSGTIKLNYVQVFSCQFSFVTYIDHLWVCVPFSGIWLGPWLSIFFTINKEWEQLILGSSLLFILLASLAWFAKGSGKPKKFNPSVTKVEGRVEVPEDLKDLLTPEQAERLGDEVTKEELDAIIALSTREDVSLLIHHVKNLYGVVTWLLLLILALYLGFGVFLFLFFFFLKKR